MGLHIYEDQKYLDDFRLNDYLFLFLGLLSDSRNPKVEMSYNNYSIHAFYTTSQDISDLENETGFINNGRRALVSVSLWFLSLESLINCLCKVVLLKQMKDFNELQNKSLTIRLTYLLTTLGYDDVAIKRSGLYNKINEFNQFRNEIFHDRNLGLPIEFKKTNFSSMPVLSNQVDIFQGMLIFIETANLLRYIVPGLDLMPNISIGKAKVIHFEKIDVMYLKYLQPFLKKVLDKHNLKIRLNLSIIDYPSLSPSSFFLKGEVAPLIKIEQETQFVYNADSARTTIGKDLYHKLVESYNLPDDTYHNPDFILDWQDFYKSNFPIRHIIQ